MSSDFNIVETESNIVESGGVVTNVTVSITLSTKPLGADAFIKMEEVRDLGSASAAEAILVRDEMLSILRDQILEQAKLTIDAVRTEIAATPRGNVTVVPVNPGPAPAGTQAGVQAPSFGAAATVAVANGATASAAGWSSVPSRFGDGDLRFLTCESYSSQQMESDVAVWLQGNGLNPDAFKTWDNRPGPKGLEAGVPQGCVANIKISKDAQEFVGADVARSVIARVKFNSNGTLYIWLTKEAEAALKYGALDRVKVQG